jgi:hypothetical protein
MSAGIGGVAIMKFMEFKSWMKEKGLTMKLEGWSGCIPDTILVFKDGKPVYTGDYYGDTDYSTAVTEIEKVLAGGAFREQDF